MNVTIDKAIPMPEIKRFGPRSTRYPYSSMEVTDSFGIAFTGDETEEDLTVAKRRLRQSVTWANRRFAPCKFSMREVDGGMRGWRVA